MMRELKVLEMFAGVGAQATALENLGIPFKADICEIDAKASAVYHALHNRNGEPTRNLGDITKVERIDKYDLLTWSFPCTTISTAGLRAGMVEGTGTASSLGWEVIRLLKRAKEEDNLPEILLMENVDAILHEVNLPQFQAMQRELEELGYHNTYKILNAADYGVPQSRRRCFMVSTLNRKEDFIFPKPIPLERKLRDLLEDDVPENYYLSAERIAKYERHKEKHKQLGHGFGWKPIERDADAVSFPIRINPSRHGETFITENDPKCIEVGNLHLPGHDINSRVYSPDGASPTIHTKGNQPLIQPECVKMGEMGDIPYKARSGVYSPDGISPTITAAHDYDVKIEEDPQIIKTGEMTDEKFAINQSVYSKDGISPAIVAGCPRNLKIEEDPLIIEAGKLTDTPYNEAQKVISIEGAAPTQKTSMGNDRTKIEVIETGKLTDTTYKEAQKVISADGVAPTQKCCDHLGNDRTKIEVIEWPQIEGIAVAKDGDGIVCSRPHEVRRSVIEDKAFAVTANSSSNSGVVCKTGEVIRIRYLTERERWRLMGFDDIRIDIAFATEKTKTARHRLAGNSIVVDVLMAIFKGLYIDQTFEKHYQSKLF